MATRRSTKKRFDVQNSCFGNAFLNSANPEFSGELEP